MAIALSVSAIILALVTMVGTWVLSATMETIGNRFRMLDGNIDDLRLRIEHHEAQWEDAESCPSYQEVADTLRVAAGYIESLDKSSS